MEVIFFLFEKQGLGVSIYIYGLVYEKSRENEWADSPKRNRARRK
jgi:hypothetical protein